jgi:hypothetical protein
MILAAGFGGVAFIVKPVFVVWPFVLPVLVVLFSGSMKPSFRGLLTATALALVFPLGWSLVHYAKYGVLAPSSIGAAAGCIYLGGRTLAISSHPSGPTRADIRSMREQIRRHRDELATEADVYRYDSTCLTEAVVRHPLAAWRAYQASAIEGLPNPFSPNELDFRANGSLLRRSIRSVMSHLNDLVLVFALLGTLRLIAAGQGRLVLGFAILFGAIWAPAALSHSQGARLIYPVESTVLILAGVGIDLLIGVGHRVVPESSRRHTLAAA